MNKLLIILLLSITVTIYSQENKTSSSITAGTEYLEEFYVNFGYSIIRELENNTELDFKVAININTSHEKANGDVDPKFHIPLKAGINFLFPMNEKFTFLAGTGISPTLLIGEDNPFLIGPNAKLGLRLKVHPSMSVLLEVCQSMLIGGENWLYPSTEIVCGVNFFI